MKSPIVDVPPMSAQLKALLMVERAERNLEDAKDDVGACYCRDARECLYQTLSPIEQKYVDDPKRVVLTEKVVKEFARERPPSFTPEDVLEFLERKRM